MKKIIILLATLSAAICMVSCGNPNELTIINLKLAIDGETAASAKYAAFADRAEQEGHSEIAALFRATSQAEAIHIENHNNVLIALGVADYTAAVPEFVVDSTLVNLNVAMNGELHETQQMYPEFIAIAKIEKVTDAIASFTHAERAEKGHATLYAEAIGSISVPGAQAAAYFICPVCGNVYAGNAAEVCEICGVQQAQFTAIHAVMALNNALLGEPVAPLAE